MVAVSLLFGVVCVAFLEGCVADKRILALGPRLASSDHSLPGDSEQLVEGLVLGLSKPQDPRGPDDPAELGVFLDDLVAARMEEEHIPGTAIVVVKDGEVFFAKGYGYADLEQDVLIDPETTLFNTGSVGKLFTWTAVMQLVEDGELDLDLDVNTYLEGFKLPDTFPGQPITLKHLMTHTPGFEDRVFEMFPSSPEDIRPLGEWLADHIPVRVRPPGEVASYSNYGAALAGFIVEEVSGMSYHEYVERRILEPLGMESTSTQTSPPDRLVPFLAQGYEFVDGGYRAGGFELSNVAPAGGGIASALDMAKFMITHLQDGRCGDIRILEEETAQQMHGHLFAHHEQLLGLAYGFVEMGRNGEWIIGHGGGTTLSSSLLALFPDHGLGLLVLYNSDGAPSRVLGEFLDHYFPASEDPVPEPQRNGATPGSHFTGRYGNTRISYTTVEKADVLLNPFTINVRSDGDTLLLAGYPFMEIEPLVYQVFDGLDMLVFREDDEGRIQYAFFNSMPVRGFEKLVWHNDPFFHTTLLKIVLGLFASYLIVFLASYAINLRRGVVRQVPRQAEAARLVVVVMAVLSIVFLVSLPQVFDFGDIAAGRVLPLKTLLVIPIISSILGVSAGLFTILAWKNRYWGVIERLHYTLVMFAGVALIWSLNCWNLLGWRF
jgi:CubicO group peptidase (beta-lactamase class C family)